VWLWGSWGGGKVQTVGTLSLGWVGGGVGWVGGWGQSANRGGDCIKLGK